MKRVTGLGGIFFRSDDPQKIREWYSSHLGFSIDEYGTSFEWRKADNPEQKGYTVWSPFKKDSNYFSPSTKDFMINLRVQNLEELLIELKNEGVEIVGELQIYEYGKFAHIMDPEGNKIELWEPDDSEYEKIAGNTTF